MSESAAVGQLYQYGVRRAPFLIRGLPTLMAVDGFGEVQKIRPLKPGEDAEAIAERMWEWLEEHHPRRPALTLVRDPEPSTAGMVKFRGRWIDPRLLNDPRSPIHEHLRRSRQVQAAARKAGVLTIRPPL